jgi:hypothetical protein
MAMERPYAWIVSVHLPDHVPASLYYLSISVYVVSDLFLEALVEESKEVSLPSLRVTRVDDAGPIPGASAFRENEHIVAMEMHGMSSRSLVVDDEAYGFIGTNVVDVPLWVGRIRCVSTLGEE